MALVQGRGMNPDSVLQPLLIVDDDEDDVLLLARRLRQAGIKNTQLHFKNGGDAFMFLKHFCPPEKCNDPLPCVMFLDVNMPGLSGFDVLIWARQQPALAGMKIFMCSGANEKWDAQIAAKLGADEYLLKFPETSELAKLMGTSAEKPTPSTPTGQHSSTGV
jgi:CheY-like chemotaxis protein